MDHTVVDYLRETRALFDEVPFNEVDSLVLSTIAYCNFEKGVIGQTIPTDLVKLPIALCGIPHDDLYGGLWLARMGGDEFLAALLASQRFMDLEIGYYANDISSHFEKQFSAVTFFFPDGKAYIAYRGTDNTLAGWKEDFNLTFMEEVPSQVSARTYLEDIADANAGNLYVGGHSKGGNLAEYAALTCRDQTFMKIERIFNHDGPGFAFTPTERIHSDEYNRKLSKTVPESSVFGMLMENRSSYRIVQSSGVLFAQHASTHWAVEGTDFVTAEKISPEAAVISGALNKWAQLYEPDQRALFIDAVYEIFCSADADTWSEFGANGPESMLAIAEAAAKLPASMRATLLGMVRDIAPILGAEAAKRALSHLQDKASENSANRLLSHRPQNNDRSPAASSPAE